MTHGLNQPYHGRGPAAALASAWIALRCLPATQPWLWLVRSGAPGGFAATIFGMCVYAHGAAPPIGLVLLDALPRLLDAFGAGACGHG